MRRFILAGSGLLLVSASACSSHEDTFDAKVAPLVEKKCASSTCHGVVAGTESGYQLDASRWLTFPVDRVGRIVDRAAAIASLKAKINSAEGTPLSTLLRKTLPVAQGGLFHFDGPVFASRSDPGYATLASWAASVEDGKEALDVPPLSGLEKLFREKAFPLLAGKGCATATCHGDLNFGVSIFRAPIDRSGLISRKDLHDAYTNARANVTLWGDPLQSRLLTKILPFEYGGIPHKGGNDTFFAAAIEQGQDPRESDAVKGVLEWIAAERAAALGDAPAGATALVVVGGPIPLAGPFDPQPFTPGSDLYRIDAPFTGAPVNITAAIHDGPADIRDPAVSHDGRTIAFTMRTSEDDAQNVYTIRLDGTGLTQLTHDRAHAAGKGVVANTSPEFGPNGGFGGAEGPAERIYFSSMRGDRSDDARYPNADLYGMNVDGTGLERFTYTCQPEVKPTFLLSGEFAGTLVYTIQRAAPGGFKGVFFRFPVDHNPAFHFQPEAHPHFGMSEPPQVFYGLREMADGRALATLQDEGNLVRGGQLAVIERQFAVEIPEGAESMSTLPGFRHALTVLDPDTARSGTSAGGLWRDPVPLPDGSILAAHAPGPVDLDAPPTDLRTRIVRVTLASDRQSSRPRLVSVEEVASGTMAFSQPVVVLARGTEDPPHPRAWNDTDTTGRLVHSGVQVIEAVLARMVPTGPRQLRDDIAYVRAVAPLATLAELLGTPLEVVPVPPGETRDGHPGATNLSLTGHMPLFAAVEIPPAPDGSLAADIPAKVPVRVVTLDAKRMAVGAQQPQWYAVLPGERFPVGIPPSSFAARCGGCHGAMDGNRQTVLQPPLDVVTQASVTEATYLGGDRRKPIAELPEVTPALFLTADFRTELQPVLDARCVSCHAGATAPGGLTLTGTPTRHYTDAYESLLALGEGSAGGYRYVDGSGHLGRRSYLIEKLRNEELEAPRALGAPCPGAGQLTADELALITRWVELGSPFVDAP